MYPMSKVDLKNLIGASIVFTDSVEEMELGFEPGMKGVIVSLTHDSDPCEGDAGGCFKARIDFGGDNLEHNRKLMSANYYDANGVACLKWEETKGYPKNHIEECYFTYGTWHKKHNSTPEFMVVTPDGRIGKIQRNPDMCVSLIDTISVNINNDKLSDAEFRQFIRNSLPVTVKA